MERQPAHLQTARLRAASGAAALAAARAARRELLARRMEIHERRQEAERLAAGIAILADQLRRSDLIAPCDGVVTTPHVEERVGAYCGEGATVVEVEDPCSLFTRIFVNEKDLVAQVDEFLGQSHPTTAPAVAMDSNGDR